MAAAVQVKYAVVGRANVDAVDIALAAPRKVAFECFIMAFFSLLVTKKVVHYTSNATCRCCNEMGEGTVVYSAGGGLFLSFTFPCATR